MLDRPSRQAAAGYEVWHNRFGNPGKPGVDTDALMFQLEWHL